MQVIPIPCFDDNYAYAVFNSNSNLLVLVDPADWPRVNSFIQASAQLQALTPSYVFTTHKHADHSGGNLEALQQHPDIKIVGGEHDGIPGCNMPVADQQQFNLENGMTVNVYHVPCHTRGHVFYYVQDGDDRVVFTGDTVFVGGCGRFFEGDAQQMFNAFRRLETLPGDTKVYCGHEYTKANLEWASKVESDNQAIRDKLQWAEQQVNQGKYTVPSTVDEEKEINVFMRAERLAQLLGVGDGVAAMARLREMKNSGTTLV